MNKKLTLITYLLVGLGLTACGSDSEVTSITEPEPEVGVIYGPFTTGTVQERVFAYYDIDTLSVLELTEEQAATNSDWDIAFKGTSVYLNNNDSDDSKEAVSLYFTDNNSDFFDNGSAVVNKFINATADSELDDFIAVSSANISENTEFSTDVTAGILEGFYNYNSTTHQVTAAVDHYFIAYSDTTVTKFRVSELTQSGYGMSSITINFVNQLSGATEFDALETELVLDATLECSNSDNIYIDFDVNNIVTSAEAWDIKIPCLDDTAADFTLALTEDATAIQDFTNSYAGVPESDIPYYGFKSDQYTVLAFKENPWYQYSLEGNHKLWSQYGVYLIKNTTGVYKLQFTSYYDTDGNSGNYSFRIEAL
ncbi:MAG: hypothetical protein MJK12_03400 [Colwellia sp.]|nr:hypothetical protein [Colwellia sp.]